VARDRSGAMNTVAAVQSLQCAALHREDRT